jgi:hypothetical protein
LASGNASITVAVNSYTDDAGNNGAAGTTPSISIDTLKPTVVSFDAGTDTSDGKFALVFSEAVSFVNVNQSGVKLYNVTDNVEVNIGDLSFDAGRTTLFIEPFFSAATGKLYDVYIAAGSLVDDAGNLISLVGLAGGPSPFNHAGPGGI